MKSFALKSLLFLSLPLLIATTCKETKKKKPVVQQPKQETTPPSITQDTAKEMLVLIKTKFGNMKVKLYNETPKHRDNFVKLAKEGYYKDLLFHRVMNTFMIQGGDPNSRGAAPGVQLGMGGPGYTVPAEFNQNLIHKKGALAAARMGDQANPRKESSGSQFYIVQGTVQREQDLQRSGIRYTPEQIKTYTSIGGTPFLDMQYTVFGEVIEGLDVIDKIAAVKTQNDRPLEDVKMDVEVLEN